MDEKWLKIVEYCKGVSQLCQALAESLEKQQCDEEEKTTETKNMEEQTVTFDAISALAKKKAAEGKSAEVKAIINGCGVEKLSAISKEYYAYVFEKLEAI